MTDEMIVAVRITDDSRYSVPAELVETWDGHALVRFAAQNLRLVRLDLLAEAKETDKEEFRVSRERWNN